MRFAVRHETLYRYSAPVRLGDHLLRLTPRESAFSALTHVIEVAPAPAWRVDGADEFGSPVTRLGFAGETDRLRVVSRFEGETLTPAAMPGDLPSLPWAADGMADYLGDGEDSAVRDFAEGLAAEAGGGAGAFLDCLARTLYDRSDRHIRPEGYAQSAAETLALGSGACRDLTVLFMAACRSLGLPARFVSGYQAKSDRPGSQRYLHAWPEVWLPGAGWRGYDPTHGIAVGDGHVALAAAPAQGATMPIEGGFWGEGVSSELEFRLEIEAGG